MTESIETKWNCINCVRFKRETIEVSSIAHSEHSQQLPISRHSSFPFVSLTPVSYLTLTRTRFPEVGQKQVIVDKMQVHAGWTYIVRDLLK